MIDLPNDEVKILKCKECGVDVPVNVVYLPWLTDGVLCKDCIAKKQ